MSQAPILQGLAFVDWILYQRKVDPAEPLTIDIISALTYLTEGLCKRSARYRCISLQQFALHKSVNYKHTYYIMLLIAFGSLQYLDLNNNDIGRRSVMSLLAQSLKHSRTLVVLQMNECNINDGGLQHLGSVLQDHETILHLSIVDNPFSSKGLTFFLQKLCSVHSRLQILQLESQRCEPAHNRIVQRINNAYRQRLHITPLEVVEFEKGPIESFVPAFFKALTMRKHYS